MKVFVIIFLIATFGCELINSVALTCQFKISNDWSFLSPIYQCYVPGPSYLTITDRSNRNVDSVSGGSYANVKAFWTQSATVHYFPLGLEKFFSNLEGIAIGSSQLKEIRQEDIKPFPDLRYLNLYSNDIEVIEQDLFKFNPKLQLLGISASKISHLDSNVFDQLNQLSFLYLSGNTCAFVDSYDKSTTIELIQKVKTQKCTNEAKLAEFMVHSSRTTTTTTTEPTTTTTTTSEPCHLEEEIAELKRILNDLTKKFANQKKQLRDVKEELSQTKLKLTEQILECKTNLTIIAGQDLDERVSYIEMEVNIRPEDYKRVRQQP